MEYTDGSPIWADLMTSDMEGAKAFYTKLFGWSYESSGEEFGGYTLAMNASGKQVAGIMAHAGDDGSPTNVWTVYLQVADAAASVEAVTAAGGAAILPASQVGDFGTMAVISDGSAVVGLWQPDQHKGFQDVGNHGAIAWTELSTARFAEAKEFYGKAFGFTYVSDPSGDSGTDDEYVIFQTPGATADGGSGGFFNCVGKVPPGTPDHWAYYWSVTDIAAAIATVDAEGGQVLVPPFEIPYGSMAIVVDPFGTVTKLIQLNPEMGG